MTPEKIDYLQSYLTDKLSVCPYTWESFKSTLKDATNNTFEKDKNIMLTGLMKTTLRSKMC